MQTISIHDIEPSWVVVVFPNGLHTDYRLYLKILRWLREHDQNDQNDRTGLWYISGDNSVVFRDRELATMFYLTFS